MSTKIVRALIILIFISHWLKTCNITRPFYDLINPFDGLGVSLILLEDVLFAIIFVLVVIWFAKYKRCIIEKGMMRELFMFFGAGFMLLVYAFILGNDDLLANFRLFAFSFLGMAFWWSFKIRKHLLCWTRIIVVIFAIDQLITLINFQIHPNIPSKHLYYNEMLAPLGIVLSCYILRFKRLFPRLYYVILPLQGVAVFNMCIYGSRSTYVYFVFFVFFMICFSTKKLNLKLFKKSNIVRTIVGMAIIILVVSFFVKKQNIQLVDRVEKQIVSAYKLEGTASARLVAWDILLKRINERPIMGRGLGGKGDGIGLRIYKDSGKKGLFIGSAHNAWLILMYQIGVVGIAIIALFFFRLFKVVQKEKVFMTDELDFYVNLIVSGFGAFIIEISFHPLGPGTYYYLWFYLGSIIAVVKIHTIEKKSKEIEYG